MDQLNSSKVVLCQLDNDWRIAAKELCFILQERTYDSESENKFKWKDKGHYGWLGGALRGYILHSLHKFAHTDTSGLVINLIDQIKKLDMSIATAGNALTHKLYFIQIDPVETKIQELIKNDPIERAIRDDQSSMLGAVTYEQ